MTDRILILDFGSQVTQLIARRVRENGVYCEIQPYTTSAEKIRAFAPRGIILSGGPASVYAPGAPLVPRYVLDSGKPILGICYGMQLLAYQLGGEVEPGTKREYGPAVVRVFHGVGSSPRFIHADLIQIHSSPRAPRP